MVDRVCKVAVVRPVKRLDVVFRGFAAELIAVSGQSARIDLHLLDPVCSLYRRLCRRLHRLNLRQQAVKAGDHVVHIDDSAASLAQHMTRDREHGSFRVAVCQFDVALVMSGFGIASVFQDHARLVPAHATCQRNFSSI